MHISSKQAIDSVSHSNPQSSAVLEYAVSFLGLLRIASRQRRLNTWTRRGGESQGLEGNLTIKGAGDVCERRFQDPVAAARQGYRSPCQSRRQRALKCVLSGTCVERYRAVRSENLRWSF